MIAFGEVAAWSVEKNWLASSGSSLLIDLLVFEVVPALFYGGIVSLVFGEERDYGRSGKLHLRPCT